MKEARQIEAIQNAQDVAQMAEQIYGSSWFASGLLHPTAVWHPPSGSLVTLEINAHTPKSLVDFFVLNFTRARSDAIVTTGKILRQEPDLSLELQGPESVSQALSAWRSEFLGKTRAPLGLVLTSGKGLDLDHPFFASDDRLIFTSQESSQRLSQAAKHYSVEVVGVEEPSVLRAIDFLREEMGAWTISNEAGPSTSLALYEQDADRVDELLLSTLIADNLPESVQGGRFLHRSEIESRFRLCSSFKERTQDGEWIFERWRRSAADSG